MQLLLYMGNNTNQPGSYRCPKVRTEDEATGWVYQQHFMGNRTVLADTDDLDAPLRATQIKRTSIYWMLMEKSPGEFCNIRPGGLGTVLQSWNVAPGSPGYRRHAGGFTATATDGHAEWLKAPPYQPGKPPPSNFGELGDTSDGRNPASSWIDNGPTKKLYCRKFQSGGRGISY
jgi:hypothetical protein